MIKLNFNTMLIICVVVLGITLTTLLIMVAMKRSGSSQVAENTPVRQSPAQVPSGSGNGVPAEDLPPVPTDETIEITDNFTDLVKEVPMGSTVTIVNATGTEITYATSSITKTLDPQSSFVIEITPNNPGGFYRVGGLGEERELVVIAQTIQQ